MMQSFYITEGPYLSSSGSCITNNLPNVTPPFELHLGIPAIPTSAAKTEGFKWNLHTLMWDDLRGEAQKEKDAAFDVLVSRFNAYPDIRSFADAMYWQSRGDSTKLDAYFTHCEAVKVKYPKASIK